MMILLLVIVSVVPVRGLHSVRKPITFSIQVVLHADLLWG
jgi:hypothetical protein